MRHRKSAIGVLSVYGLKQKERHRRSFCIWIKKGGELITKIISSSIMKKILLAAYKYNIG